MSFKNHVLNVHHMMNEEQWQELPPTLREHIDWHATARLTEEDGSEPSMVELDHVHSNIPNSGAGWTKN